MFRVIDNKDGAILALCFSEEMADRILLEDGETIRYVWEDCFDHPETMIGDSLKQLGNQIQMRRPKRYR